jgi:hypothetical protein
LSRDVQGKVAKLRALAEHEATPENERENALKRIEEIEGKLEQGQIEHKMKCMPTSMAQMASRVKRQGLANFKKHIRKAAPREDARTVKDKWPFGWTKKAGQVEHEVVGGRGSSLYVSWKCPECGRHVTKILNYRHQKRLEGQSGGVDGYIEKVTNGTMNQLCFECWEEWDNK